VFDVELGVVIVEVKHVDVDLEGAEQSDGTYKCDVDGQSTDGRRRRVADFIAVDLTSDIEYVAAGVYLEKLTTYTTYIKLVTSRTAIKCVHSNHACTSPRNWKIKGNLYCILT